MAKRGRTTADGDQSSSGVGGDDRDRQGQRIQDPDSPRARGEDRSGGRVGDESGASRNTGSGLRPNKAGRGSTVDTGDRASRSEKPTGERKRSGSDSNRS